MTIVIVYRLDTNGYTKETCKGTGRNGRRKNIGPGTAIMIAEGMVIKAAESVVDTKNGVRRMMAWDLLTGAQLQMQLLSANHIHR